MRTLKEQLKHFCETWIAESDRGLKKMKGSEYWTGYHNGQKRMAESILKMLEEKKSN